MTHAHFMSDPEVVYENRYQRTYTRTVKFDRFTKQYFVTDYGHRAAVLLISPDGVLLTRQYRHLIDDLSWEIPGGRVEAGEQPEDAARRECIEETGLDPGTLEPLIAYQQGLDTLLNPTHVFTARVGSLRLPPREADNEVSSRHWVPLEQCLSMIDEGQIVDSLSILALLAYDRHRRLLNKTKSSPP